MDRDPYQIIVMRPTGGRPIMTIGSTWAKCIIFSILAMMVCLVILGLYIMNSQRTFTEQSQMIRMQSSEIKDLNIRIARKDEEIISLKNKLSMAITHKIEPTGLSRYLPEIHTPIAKLTDIILDGQSLFLKIVSIKTDSRDYTTGYFFAVFQKGTIEKSYPDVALYDGIPNARDRGIMFSIRNFKPLTFNAPRTMPDWDTVIFYIFDMEGKLRLAMPMKKNHIKRANL